MKHRILKGVKLLSEVVQLRPTEVKTKSLLVNLFSSISSHLYKRDTYLCLSECTDAL